MIITNLPHDSLCLGSLFCRSVPDYPLRLLGVGVKQKLSRAGQVLEEVLDGFTRKKNTKNRFFSLFFFFLMTEQYGAQQSTCDGRQ